ncbi:MAG: methyl-accepting chemotaxis protein [Peptostreptococcaceae bacterium]|jgi:methyl-accepting chemotaxis protein|nr:methyl-accepting chemotaxis protein [Peptostreptococcaceae bacterium]
MSSLKNKVILILLLVSLPFVSIVINSFLVFDRLSDDGVAINLAGSQRMRTMLISNYVQQYVSAKENELENEEGLRELILKELELYKKINQALIDGDKDLNLHKNKNYKIVEYIRLIKKDVDNYVFAVTNLMDGLNIDDHKEYVLANAMDVKNKINKYVQMYQASYDLKIENFKTNIYIMIFLGLITSLIAFIYSNKKLIKPIRTVTKSMQELSKGNINIKMNFEDGEVGKMSKAFNTMSENLQKQKSAMINILNGNLNFGIEVRSEFDIINIKILDLKNYLNNINFEIKRLSKDIDNGILNSRADVNEFEGIWKILINNINNLVDSFTKPIKLTQSYLDKIGKGDIPKLIEDEYHGEFNNIKNNLNNSIKSINYMIKDTNYLIDNVVQGNLEARIDTNRHKGEYKRLIKSINNIMEVIVEPIKESSKVLNKLSDGELNYHMIGEYLGDYKIIKGDLNKTIDNLNSYIYEMGNVLDCISKRDFDVEIEFEFKGDFKKVGDYLESIINNLNDIFKKIKLSMNDLSDLSFNVLDLAQNVSASSDIQASKVLNLKENVDFIVDGIESTNKTVSEVECISNKSIESTKDGKDKMSKMIAAMDDIKEASSNISKIIKVINEISFQTNFLALNASVEAARAGQNGKGFAVVAQEVRNLANRSSKASSDTEKLIENTLEKVDYGYELSIQASSSMNDISDGNIKTKDLIYDMIKDFENENAILVDIKTDIDDIYQIILDNKDMSLQSKDASEELRHKVEKINKDLKLIKTKSKLKLN